MRISRPPNDVHLCDHIFILLSILWCIQAQSLLLYPLGFRINPKYFKPPSKCLISSLKMFLISKIQGSFALFETRMVLLWFMKSPKIREKSCRIADITYHSEWSSFLIANQSLKKIKCDKGTRSTTQQPINVPLDRASKNFLLRPWMIVMNKSRDITQPCPRPREAEKGFVGMSLTRMENKADLIQDLIHWIIIFPRTIFWRNIHNNSHSTQSNALDISNFIRQASKRLILM